MEESKHARVWLAVTGIVINEKGEWLVVRKRYGGLDGFWSLPAGFVQKGETIDEACLREIEEETNIKPSIQGFLGFRTGVIKHDISDNMGIFLLTAESTDRDIIAQLDELYEARWMSPKELKEDDRTSHLILAMLELPLQSKIARIETLDKDNVFGYTSYKLFF